MDTASYLSRLEEELEGSPDAGALRAARELLDDPAFLHGLKDHLRKINDPDALAAILGRIRRMTRRCEDRSESSAFHKDMALRLGVTGGGGLVFASIIGAITAAAPLLMLIPFAGGTWMAWRGYSASHRLNEEALLYKHLAERMGKISEAVHA